MKYREQAVKDTGEVWAGREGEDREQARLEYAVTQRAARLRAEAALAMLTVAVNEALTQAVPLVDALIEAQRKAKEMFVG